MARPEDHFRQTITFALPVSRDAWGKATLGSQLTAAARVQPTRTFVRDSAGDSVQALNEVYTLAVLTLQHRVWLPGDNTADDTKSRRILAIDALADGNATVRFFKVWL